MQNRCWKKLCDNDTNYAKMGANIGPKSEKYQKKGMLKLTGQFKPILPTKAGLLDCVRIGSGIQSQYGSIRIQVNPDNGHFYSYVWDRFLQLLFL